MELIQKDSSIGTDYYVYEKLGKIESDIEYLSKNMENQFKDVYVRFGAIDQRFVAIDKRFDEIDQRFVAIDKRFDEIDQRFVAIEQRFEAIDSRLTQVDKKIDSLQQDVYRRFNEFDKKFDRIHVFMGLGFTSIATLITIFNFI